MRPGTARQTTAALVGDQFWLHEQVGAVELRGKVLDSRTTG
jgi:hypothetical protein